MTRSSRGGSATTSRLPKIAGDVVTWGALWSAVSILLQGFGWPMWVDEAFSLISVPTAPNLFVAALLLIVGEALHRRLRVAWWIVVLFQGLAALTFVSGLAFVLSDLEEMMSDPEVWGDLPPSVGLAGYLISTIATTVIFVIFVRRRVAFPAQRPAGSLREAVTTLVLGLLAVLALTFGLSWFASGTLAGPGERLLWSAQHTVGLSLPFGTQPGAHTASPWLGTVAGVLAAGVLLLAIWRFVHSARRAELMTAQEEVRLRALLARNGEQDSLAYFATRRDKSLVFAPDGSAAVAYRVVGPVCLASGDPIGAVEDWPKAITAWLEHARLHAWHPGVLSASEHGATAYVAAGMRARNLGDEAVVDVDRFTLEGRAMRPVKRAVARVRAAGCDVHVERHADLPASTLDEIIRLAEQWRGDEPDRGFSMALNRLGDRADGRCVAVVMRDAEGAICAVQSFVPWGARGLSLDLMRRSPAAPNGVNEAMVAALVEAAPDLGVRHVSLNFAMFRSVFSGADKVGAGMAVRIADRILMIANRFWQLESLYEANAKYLPRWEPRFVCFETVGALPQIGLAAGAAEGFLPGRVVAPDRTGEDLVVVNGSEPRPLADLILEQDRELLTPPRPTRRIGEQQQVRLDKLTILREACMEPYPVKVPRTGSVHDALALVDATDTPGQVSVTGRVRAIRDLGGVLFCTLEEHGVRIQGVLERDVDGGPDVALWRRTVDVGDHVSLTGRPGRSRTGEASILVASWRMASKCLRPIPDVRTGFTNPEARARQRYLDLLVNPESVAMLQARSRAVAAIRHGFAQRGYMEVETPMLQVVHGGASARPFRTHINAYNAELYLRIAPELFLKHLCVGGMDRIFELNRNFRNEGADATHNPEFTSVEAYAAHGDYNAMRDLARELIIEVATATHGEPVAVRPRSDGTVERIRLDGEWPVITVHEAVSRAVGVELTSRTTVEEARAVADRHGVHHTPAMTSGEIVLELYDELVEGQTTFPTFYTDFPLETSPLTRTHRTDPRLSERWDLVAFGAEIGTAYSELVDPVDQRQRLTEQSYKAAAGDPEAMEIDEGFLTALEYAMPPTGGLGIGVDRLVMMLTGANIRATLAFPFTRPSERG